MLQEDLFAELESSLSGIALTWNEGMEFESPALSVLRVGTRATRLSWMPWIGRSMSVVLVARQPLDLGLSATRTLVDRLCLVAEHLCPRRRAFSVIVTAAVITPEPIGDQDESQLEQALRVAGARRSFPIGLFRINLGQEAFAFSLRKTPSNLFPEPMLLADALSTRLKRYVPPFQTD